MDALEFAAVHRARSALDMVASTTSSTAKAKAFTDLALTLFCNAQRDDCFNALKTHPNSLVAKAAAHSTLDSGSWGEGNASDLAASYLTSIAELSVLDQLKKYATVLPRFASRVLVAADSVGDVVREGDPKPVRHLGLSLSNIETTKSASIIVMSDELARAGGAELRRLFENELSKAVARATNHEVMNSLISSNTQSIASTGDPLQDLRAGLRAAGPSYGYVVAMPTADVADLSTRIENRGGMTVRGGTFVPGVEVVAVDSATDMQIIPASHVALVDEGLQVRSAGHATVNMRDTQESPDVMVNLWQTNSLGLLVERNWHIASAEDVVIVESGS